MIFIQKCDEQNSSQMLSYEEFWVNNLKILIDEDQITLDGQWEGTLEELKSIVEDLEDNHANS